MDDAARGNRLAATLGSRPGGDGGSRPIHTRVLSTPANLWRPEERAHERAALLRRHSLVPEAELNDMGDVGSAPIAGGTILGIHNLAIVIPQFIVSGCQDYQWVRGKYWIDRWFF